MLLCARVDWTFVICKCPHQLIASKLCIGDIDDANLCLNVAMINREKRAYLYSLVYIARYHAIINHLQNIYEIDSNGTQYTFDIY